MAENVVEFSDQNFEEEVLKTEGLTLVDFWASWCSPCKILAPVVEEMAEDYVGRVKVGKLNIDENPKTAAHYAIRSIPTLLLFKDNEMVEQIVGVQSKETLQKLLDKNLP
jgi:thioredoxin 1|tara:strand:+ start:172 stop:501 length:330 start_codon:yes stop_codon:yes gene_type:complete